MVSCEMGQEAPQQRESWCYADLSCLAPAGIRRCGKDAKKILDIGLQHSLLPNPGSITFLDVLVPASEAQRLQHSTGQDAGLPPPPLWDLSSVISPSTSQIPRIMALRVLFNGGGAWAPGLLRLGRQRPTAAGPLQLPLLPTRRRNGACSPSVIP